MMKILAWTWKRLGSIQLTVVLSLLLTVDLSIGYVCMDRRTIIFAPLNDIGLAAWMTTYGRNNLAVTAWFFILLCLLTLLSVNTFVCTTDRVVSLVRRRRYLGKRRLFFKFAPHIMHYAMIVILIGYLCSYLFSTVVDNCTLIPDLAVRLPGTKIQMILKAVAPEYYQKNRLPAFYDRVMQPEAMIEIFDGGSRKTAVLNYNQPLRFQGYGIFLKDFTPKIKGGGMNPQIRLDLSVRKDPGVNLYLAGILLFTAGLFMYVAEWIFFKNTSGGMMPYTAYAAGERNPADGGRKNMRKRTISDAIH